jgi:DNA-binding cell septation regulator SpoVG
VTAAIEVLEVRRLSDGGNLKAFAKVKLGCVVIHGCRIIQQDGQRPWVALPQQPARRKSRWLRRRLVAGDRDHPA